MKLGRWFGVDVSAHWSVLILAMLSFNNVSSYLSRYSPHSEVLNISLASLVFTVGILLSILAHEFGHILVGRRYGVGFQSVILHALGGAARMDGHIPTAKSEFLMALAGPAVSIALFFVLGLGAVFGVVLGYDPASLPMITLGILASTNLILGIFNLLPAYPLDGGRVVRAAVWAATKNFLKATKVAATIGTFFGAMLISSGILMSFGIEVPFFGVGIGSGLWIGVIGMLTILAAQQELKHYQRMSLT